MKRIWPAFIATWALSLAVVGIAIWLSLPFVTKSSYTRVTSPLPSFLTAFSNAQVTTLDIWQPLEKVVLGITTHEPAISATSYVSYDLTTDEVLLQKDANKRLPMASLTKIMTAIVALEHSSPDDVYTVPQSALVGEDSMGLIAGEKLSLKELLYGLVMHSANDAAETIAANYPGGREAFITAMNQKAVTLGLQNTHFTNPTGLEGDGNQYTTTYDLLVITRFALHNFPVFKEAVATFDYTVPATSTHQEYDLENETNLISSYPGVKGVKDGYTPEAGLCLVTYLEYKGHQIIAVVLGSDDRRGDMKDILDYSLRIQGITPPHHG